LGDRLISPIEKPLDVDNDSYDEDDSEYLVIYDLENNQVIVPKSEDEIIEPTMGVKKVISRNVNNSQRRRFR
jgi:hypothetical protein